MKEYCFKCGKEIKVLPPVENINSTVGICKECSLKYFGENKEQPK